MCPRSLPGARGGGKSESASTRYVSGSDLCPAWETKLNWPQPCDPGMGYRSDGGRSVVNGKRVSQPLISHPHLQARALKSRDSGCCLSWTESLNSIPGRRAGAGTLNPALTCGRSRRRAALNRGRLHGEVARLHAWQRCREVLALVAAALHCSPLGWPCRALAPRLRRHPPASPSYNHRQGRGEAGPPSLSQTT